MTIYEKLYTIQQNLKAPKSQHNSFGDYNYRSCEDIQEAVKPLLGELKAVLLLEDDIKLIGDRYYIVASATLQDVESDESITNIAYARETDSKPKMDAAQITGSCSSYARKYALNGLFCIDDAKDPDTMNNGTQAKQTGQQAQTKVAPVQLVSVNHINTIYAELGRTGASLQSVLNRYKITKIEEMTIQQFNSAMKSFKVMPDKESFQMSFQQYINDEMANMTN